MNKLTKITFRYVLIISVLFVFVFTAYVGYQSYYKERTECYMQHGSMKGLSILLHQFQYDLYRSIVGVSDVGDTMVAVDILTNEKDLGKYPQFSCRVHDEVSKAKEIIKSFNRS